jgi:hypothetical protein
MCSELQKCFLILSLTLIFSGCATVSSVEKSYNDIDFSSSITRREARIIAQKNIIQTNFKSSYTVVDPKIYDASEFDVAEKRKELFQYTKELYADGKLRYSGSWYVVFHPKPLSLFSVYYLVVVDKSSGQVQYAQEENAFAALAQLIVSESQNDALQSAVVAVRYYSEKGCWPSDSQELQEYFEEKVIHQDQRKHFKINFKDLQFEQIAKGQLLIIKKKDGGRDVTPLYEIQPLEDNKFIVNYKKDIIHQDYVLKITGDRITVNPYFQDDKKNHDFIESLSTLFAVLGIPSK